MSKYEFTPEQKKEILDLVKSGEEIGAITRKIFNNPKLSGKHKEGKLIIKFLASLKIKPKTSKYEKSEDIELTEDQKTFIANEYANGGKTLHITQTLFNNYKLEPLSKECQAVAAYIKTLPQVSASQVYNKNDNIATGNYVPPRTFNSALKRANAVLNNVLQEDKLTINQKRGIEKLVDFLHSTRFLATINNYSKESSRKLFEEEFIRATYDKPDLSIDEVNLYINLCSDYIAAIEIQRHIDMLNQRLEDIGEDPDGKISMGLVEMIGKKTAELENCLKRQKDLVKHLSGERSTRIAKKRQETASMIAVVEVWKQEEERRKMLEMAEIRQKLIEEEIVRLESLDDFKARILGITKEEILGG